MLYALVVIYNKNCNESLSLQSLIKYKNKIKIIVYDNSTKNYNNKAFCDKNKIAYYSFLENNGLSKAYNYVLKHIKKTSEDYILILDDDTKLNSNYINEIMRNVKDCNYDIYLPVIRANNKIISPSNVQFHCRIKSVKKIENIDMRKISAINSGMVIRTVVFKDISYNEELFLDYVDHDFMKKVRKHYSIKILNNPIEQNYSRFKKGSINSEIIRFKIYKKDYKKYCSECNRRLFYILSISFYSIKKCIKYKTLKFLLIFGGRNER